MEVTKKTPYQGKNRCYGFFKCQFGHYWESRCSWANCGQRCKKCVMRQQPKSKTDKDKPAIDPKSVQYTYPHSQTPLSEIELYCEECDGAEESFALKSKPCPCGKGMLNPWYFLTCPKCRFEHSWPHNSEEVKEFVFVCSDYTESGCGCGEVIGLSKRQPSTEASSSGPHVDVLCEKCEQLGSRCTKHKRRKHRRRNADRHAARAAAASALLGPSHAGAVISRVIPGPPEPRSDFRRPVETSPAMASSPEESPTVAGAGKKQKRRAFLKMRRNTSKTNVKVEE